MKAAQYTIVVGLIKNSKGEILLARRNQPDIKAEHNKWEFPGGGIGIGETPEQALIREIKEETGLKIKIVQLLPKIYSHLWKGQNRHILIISYLCKVIGGQLGKHHEKEIAELKFIHPKDISKYQTLPQIKPSIKEFAPYLST